MTPKQEIAAAIERATAQEMEERRNYRRIQAAKDVHDDRQRSQAATIILPAGYKQPHFTYEPLPSDVPSFRLLRFVGGRESQNELVCELSNHSLANKGTHYCTHTNGETRKNIAGFRSTGSVSALCAIC